MRPTLATVDLLRPLLALAVLVLLVRAARVAWAHRTLTVALWRAVTWRHVAGTVGLFVVVAGTATALVVTIPWMGLGLGHLFGTTGNAVFAPLETGLALATPPPPSGPDWVLLVGASLFLLPLTALLPWLAYVEEELFRAGLEHASWLRVVVASVVFGLLHLVMLVPLGAGLAIGVAGFAYAVVYRRAYRSADVATTPVAALRAFRPTRRSRTAADRDRPAAEATTPVGVLDRTPERHQATAVFRAAVWHTSFNTLVVATVWGSLVATALA